MLFFGTKPTLFFALPRVPNTIPRQRTLRKPNNRLQHRIRYMRLKLDSFCHPAWYGPVNSTVLEFDMCTYDATLMNRKRSCPFRTVYPLENDISPMPSPFGHSQPRKSNALPQRTIVVLRSRHLEGRDPLAYEESSRNGPLCGPVPHQQTAKHMPSKASVL